MGKLFAQRRTATLRTHLIVLTVTVMLPVLAFGALTVRQIGESYRDAAEARLKDAASGLALALDQTIELHFASLSLFAQSPLLDEGAADNQALYEYANFLGETLGTYIVVTGEGLQQLVNTSRPYGVELPKNAPDGPASRTFRSAKPFVSDVYIGRVSGRGVVSFFYPVMRDGRVVKVIDMPLDPRRLSRLLESQGLSEPVFAMLTDGANRIVARSQDIDRYATAEAPAWYSEALEGGRDGVVIGPSLEGVDHAFAFHKLDNAPWTVAVAEPLSIYEGRWRDPLVRLAVGGAMLLILAALLATWLAARLARPVNALARDADAVLANGAPALPMRSSGVAEFERLKRSLARAADVLRAQTDAQRRATENAQEARAEAERANLSKSKFLAAASHDLRQPVQSLFMYAKLLERHVGEGGRDALRQQERSLDALKDLLDGLLDVSRLDAGKATPRIESFPIADMLAELDAAYAPAARERGLDWRADRAEGVYVRSDPMLLGRILRNLIDNALRFTSQGFVHVNCRSTDGKLAVEVADSGVGVAPDQQKRIFEEFHQVGNPERDRAHGLGLGLAIVERLARLLGHEITLVSEPGRGSIFGVEVPQVPAPPEARRPAPSASPRRDESAIGAGARPLVVAVDDDALVLMGLAATIESLGYDVLAASGGAEAERLVREADRAPAVVIADWRLRGGETGGQAVVRVRAAVGRDIAGVILTGDMGAEIRAEAERLGLRFMQKPVMPRELAEALDCALGGAPA